ncbi:hypothetical protein AUK18_02710 [Candidatus Beckwithbacteria bacterium CG2_30_44_31]|uniref:Uncharacterized protein n=1 Tax=Candidatus Beckwithbacteria bacterium CG2_30_44_31 TaxID=1805035 RepID=A0A1J5B807_9BACT|nr:MAG: hypothetical protein AUK18_02710 [Candidatus Beckwithbacteria bacterium CG2_30_44_31]
MNNLTVSLDQLVPFSQARANLADVVDRVKNTKFLVLTKRQKPAIAFVDTNYLAKLISIYKKWQRETEFSTIMGLASKDNVSENQVMQDAIQAVASVRKRTKKQWQKG